MMTPYPTLFDADCMESVVNTSIRHITLSSNTSATPGKRFAQAKQRVSWRTTQQVSPSCSGHVPTGVPGTAGRARLLQKVVTSTSSSGHVPTGVPGTSGRAGKRRRWSPRRPQVVVCQRVSLGRVDVRGSCRGWSPRRAEVVDCQRVSLERMDVLVCCKRWSRRRAGRARANGCPWNKCTCEAAAEGGHLDVLKWSTANGCPWNNVDVLVCCREWSPRRWPGTCQRVSLGRGDARLLQRGGHLDVLQWARATGCPWDTFTCHAAAEKGHLDVLKWLRANGCPWSSATCQGAARGGHLDVLQWARANGCPWDTFTRHAAAGRSHWHVCQWARANGCP